MARIDLSHRPRSREELAGWYATALDDQASSGLSVAEYATGLGVTAATLYQWRRRLAAQDTVELDRPDSFGLIEVMPDSTPGPDETESTLVVRLGRDREIDVPREFDAGDLRRLVTVLESC